MLLNANQLAPLYCCPRTGEALVLRDGRLLSEVTGHEYEIRAGVPILLDSDRTVIAPGEGTDVSPVERRHSKLGSLARRLLRPANPATRANIAALSEEVRSHVAEPRVLVIGGGTVGVGSEPLYGDLSIQIVAFDIYQSPWTQFVADGHQIPLIDDCMDGVLVQAVLEHVLDPALVAAEIRRVLKNGGIVYSEVPFLQGVHEGAYDFTRFTESGHRWLFREFEELSSGVVTGVGTQLSWALAGFFGGLTRSRVVAKAVMAGFSWLRFVDRLAPSTWNSDFACATYFLGRKGPERLTPSLAINRYSGAQ